MATKITKKATTTTKTTDDLVVEIDGIGASGEGLARLGHRRVSVPLTIPGERVRVRLERAREGHAAATPLEVLRPSPHRVSPRCAHFAPGAGPSCGGCSWQHIAYPEQVRLKTDLLARLIRAAVPDAPAPRPMLVATSLDDPWQYRHKVHFVFGAADRRQQDLAMGHYARGSRRIVAVSECPVHDDRGNAIAFAVRDACRAARAGRTLKSVAVRVGSGTAETMATLVVTGAGEKPLRAATHALLSGDAAPTSLHLNVHPKGDAFIFGRETRQLAGPARMREHVDGISFLISPTAFFQTNVRAAALLVQLVLDAVPEHATVLDLYAGMGLFALPLARRGHRVVAVEESHAAVADGVASRDLNRIPEDRCRFIAAPVERALVNARVADVVVLDPPREGCERPVLKALFGTIAPRLAVYISCNPEALARDLAVITKHGYTLASIQPVDMFPHTAHVEAVVVLASTGSRKQEAGGRKQACQEGAAPDLAQTDS